MKAAFAPVRRVSSTPHMLGLGQSAGRLSGRIVEDQEACFLYASQDPPPACVRCVGIRASGRPSGGDGSLTGWWCMQ